MARAYKIYIISHRTMPIAAFTVKHEAKSWIAENVVDFDKFIVWILADNNSKAARKTMTINEFMAP